jgi:RNA polymerase-binding protein DksA
MKRTETEHFRDQLRRLADRLNGEVTSLAREALQSSGGDATGGLSRTPMHLADLGTDHFEQELSLGFLENKTRTLEEIAEAVQRIRDGTFGQCERCGRDIAVERLQAVPFTRHCIACARKLEQREAAQGASAR